MSEIAQGIYQASPPALNDGEAAPLLLTAAGALVTSGGGGGGSNVTIVAPLGPQPAADAVAVTLSTDQANPIVAQGVNALPTATLVPYTGALLYALDTHSGDNVPLLSSAGGSGQALNVNIAGTLGAPLQVNLVDVGSSPVALGQTNNAGSIPVALASDTAINQLPAALGQTTNANSLSVALASNTSIPQLPAALIAGALSVTFAAAGASTNIAQWGGVATALGQTTNSHGVPVALASDTAINQLPASLAGGRLDTNVGSWLGSTAPTVGQHVAANSIPVIMASDVPGPVNVAQVGGSAIALGQHTSANSMPVVLPSDQAAPYLPLNTGSLNYASSSLPFAASVLYAFNVTGNVVTALSETNNSLWMNMEYLGGSPITLGGKVAANSVPVVDSQDQSTLSSTGSLLTATSGIVYTFTPPTSHASRIVRLKIWATAAAAGSGSIQIGRATSASGGTPGSPLNNVSLDPANSISGVASGWTVPPTVVGNTIIAQYPIFIPAAATATADQALVLDVEFGPSPLQQLVIASGTILTLTFNGPASTTLQESTLSTSV